MNSQEGNDLLKRSSNVALRIPPGSDGGSSSLDGYTIVEAADLDAAVAMAKVRPILAASGSVDVHTAMNM